MKQICTYRASEPVRSIDLKDCNDLVTNSLEAQNYSPDAAVLQQYLSQDIFVYGSLKKNFAKHHMLSDEAYPLGVGFTASSRMTMLRFENGYAGYPVVFLDTQTEHAACIYGEVWRIPTRELFKLDYYESNKIMFNRIKIPVSVEQPNDDRFIHPCWMYLGMKSYWSDRMKSLHACDKMTPNKTARQKYYIYMKKYEVINPNAVPF